ncbi:hypothetical protein A6M23_13095 [Acidithiobacillus thiooxidans]|uniref:Uncharacterized protein n=1 Tax=Acidithiobacillus thiooxidans TaxID=930 RepID=A0A1C2I4Q3_ACITH|nr:hypothetical protein A6M23_13095 [Acidithiobacillus thiooxidans]OCX84407.1 hypothetical protein A6P08_08945 [Acidithiobacillus thiooxidans]
MGPWNIFLWIEQRLQHRCSVVVFGELDWSSGTHQQVIWRVDREGQQSPVTVFFLVVEDGSDGPIMEILGLKASEAHQIVDPFTGPERTDRDMARFQALVQRYLTRASGAQKNVQKKAGVAPHVTKPEQQDLRKLLDG